MSVVREKNRRTYTIIDNRLLYDQRLSHSSKYMMWCALSQSDTFVFYEQWLRKITGFGRSKVLECLRELSENGYVDTVKGSSKFDPNTYRFFETCMWSENEIQKSNLKIESEKQTHNKDYITKDYYTKDQKIKSNKHNHVHSANDTSEIPDLDLFSDTHTPIACVKKDDAGADSEADRKWKLEKFEEWWNKYNKKKSKDPCLKKWLKLRTTEINKALEVVDDYVLTTPDIRYRKLPQTYINQKCWHDDLSEELKRFAPNRRYNLGSKSSYRDDSW